MVFVSNYRASLVCMCKHSVMYPDIDDVLARSFVCVLPYRLSLEYADNDALPTVGGVRVYSFVFVWLYQPIAV